MHYTTKLIQQISRDYSEGVPAKDICEKYGFNSECALYTIVHKWGVKRKIRAGRTSYRLYMLVSYDAQELPLTAPAETVMELAEISGKKLGTLYQALTRGNFIFYYPNGKNNKPVRARIVRIDLEEEQ